MEYLTNNKISLNIEDNGFYEYEVKNVSELNINVLANIKCEIVIYYLDEIKIKREINIENNASLDILHINNTKNYEAIDQSYLASNSSLNLGYYELNDNNINIDSKINLNGEDSKCEVSSVAITNDNTKKISIECIHNVKETTSLMKNFEISNEKANYEVIASGTIKKGAIHANSKQNTRVLTTSDNQHSEVTPLLLIDENDVVASHANALGQMNSDHLYYLMSRGLSRVQATGLLTLSYLLPIKDVISNEEVKNKLEDMIRSKVGL